MGLEIITLNKVIQRNTNLKNDTKYLFAKQKQTHRLKNKLVVTKGEWWGRGL